MIVFSLLYGVISYTFSYFGGMITYLGMSGPMALFALISWLRNSYNGNHAAVEDISYLSVIICFVMFLVNDLYGLVCWKRMEKRQMATA
jgi:nicotinamide riboside transporter PnuC